MFWTFAQESETGIRMQVLFASVEIVGQDLCLPMIPEISEAVDRCLYDNAGI